MAQDVVDNDIFNNLKERWYNAGDHPVALLRSEAKFNSNWIVSELKGQPPAQLKVLDVGCGAGFLCNRLGELGFQTTGIDISLGAIEVAKGHDRTGKVRYVVADAGHLPFLRSSFDVVTCIDLLEHVEDPESVVAEIARVLKFGGVLFFQTLNRNWISYLVALKGVKWFVRNTPERLHVYRMFIKPGELAGFCRGHGLTAKKWRGLRPRLNGAFWRMLRTGFVDEGFSFQESRSLAISYIGKAVKTGSP